MNKKNKFYELLETINKYNFSDIHIGADDNVYIRNNIGDIKQINFKLDRDEIFGFAHDTINYYKYEELIEGNEIDAAYSYKDSRYRLNFYFGGGKINVALRKISNTPPQLAEIGIDDSLNNFFLSDKGLILITGSTGSGKTTTLASIINYINENKKSHIITLEDPIEYIFESKKSRIIQREIGKDTKSWLNGIKYSLRQDPDVIMVGEMRDLETISAVLTLVETGHLVIATLHTVDAVQTISRIIDVFPAQQRSQVGVQLSLALKLIISQKLIPHKTKDQKIAAREILINNSAISNMIREGKLPQIYSLMETQLRNGMMTMDHCLAKYVAKGEVDLNVVIPKVKNMNNFKSLIEFHKKEIMKGISIEDNE